ncbi:hypothetical protein [Paenibacillus sp. NEAU-GSW1]|uniref:hypothetical protein n=1 Tax=Paenibacillus sp. NEAU-GSW1 TaxID=2682486 RepID=UPI0012E1B4D2|nr:hypothetical protein [Paenibacillus sp. NEAU-GSW1]MUT68496.1 hypothetical protein [Paenibacillus sp. NEAU-GSW1]
MTKTLLDISIDKLEMPNEVKRAFIANGINSISHIVTNTVMDLWQVLLKHSIEIMKKDVASIRESAFQIGEDEGFGWDTVQIKVGTFIGYSEANKLIGLRNTTFIKLLHNGTFNEFLLHVGRDVLPSPLRNTPGGSFPKFAFIRSGVEAFMKRYKSLPEIAEEMGYNYTRLAIYSKAGLMDEAKIAKGKWDSIWIKENFKKIKMESVAGRSAKRRNYFGMLSPVQQKIINEFIDYRTDNKVVFSASAQFPKFKQSDAPDDWRAQIARAYYSIICFRSGINNWWELEGRNGYRLLTEDERKKFNPELFDFMDINSNDIQALVRGKGGMTRFSVKKYIRGFFYYLLMQEKEEIRAQERATGLTMQEARARLVAIGEDLDENLEKFMSRENAQPDKESTSLFLTRKQLVQMIHNVFNSTGKNLHTPIKNTAMLALGFFSCIRPIEMSKLEIDKHFELDQTTKLIKLKEFKGSSGETYKFGVMHVTRDISKMRQSPSGKYGILLVPKVVHFLNLYLENLYNKYTLPRGKGYLFRPQDTEEFSDSHYSSSASMVNWMSYHKDMFEGILSEDEISHFSSYDTRHTGNNLIAKRTFFRNLVLEEQKSDVAEYHSRHKGKKSTNKEHYQEKIDLESYVEVINAALNFPFNLDELEIWENKMLGITPPPPVAVVSDEPPKLDVATKKQISKINAELDDLKQRFNALGKLSKLSITERTKLGDALEEKIQKLTTEKDRLILAATEGDTT